MYGFSMQSQYKEMKVGFQASFEEQQMDNPCVSGEDELTTSVQG